MTYKVSLMLYNSNCSNLQYQYSCNPSKSFDLCKRRNQIELRWRDPQAQIKCMGASVEVNVVEVENFWCSHREMKKMI